MKTVVLLSYLRKSYDYEQSKKEKHIILRVVKWEIVVIHSKALK